MFHGAASFNRKTPRRNARRFLLGLHDVTTRVIVANKLAMSLLTENAFLYLARQVSHYAGKERWRMPLFYVLCVIANVFIVLQPLILAQIVNSVQAGGADFVSKALSWCAIYFGSVVLFWTFHGPSRVIERRLSFSVYRRFVAAMYSKVAGMPLKWHQDHHSGDTINRVTKAGRALWRFSQEQFISIQLTVRLLGSLLFLAFYSWWVALTAALFCFALFATIKRFDRRLVRLNKIINERDHALNAGVFDYISNIITVLTLRLQKRTHREIRRRLLVMRHPFWQDTLLNEWKWFLVNIVLVFLQAGQVGLYIFVTTRSGLPLAIGAVVAIFQYQLMINQIFFQGMMNAEQILRYRVDAMAVDSLVEDHRNLAVTASPAKPAPWQRLTIRRLAFTHSEGDQAMHHLNNVDLTIQAGQKIALVGVSGAGKSTLLALLRGLYDEKSVSLVIDDTAYSTLKPLAAFTTLIPQDAEIFENTILYNLTLGMPIAANRLSEALHITTFDGVVAELPEGLATDIRERGVNLSGGQKQRLALARGLLASQESSLLLLDEPTSSVDMETESVIFDRLFDAMPEKAILASVHRLRLLPRFDWICLVRGGEIVQQGTFRELTAAEGPFLSLWQRHLAHGGDADFLSDAVKQT